MFQLLSSALTAAEIEGFWKFTEESIEQITAFTVNSMKKTQEADEQQATEIAENHRNHIREFQIKGTNQVKIKAYQFKDRSDPYPEFKREFDLVYGEKKNGEFTISKDGKNIFEGSTSGNSMILRDSGSGNEFEMRKLKDTEIPASLITPFIQPKLKKKPKAIKLTDPIYPPLLKDANETGVVEIEFVVNTDGRTSEIQIVSSPHDEFSKSAIEAIRTSTFKPGEANGKQVRTKVKIPITFR